MNYGNYSYIEAFPAGYATQRPRVNVARRSQLFEIWIRPVVAHGAREPPRPDALRHARGDVRAAETIKKGDDFRSGRNVEGVLPQQRGGRGAQR